MDCIDWDGPFNVTHKRKDGDGGVAAWKRRRGVKVHSAEISGLAAMLV